VEPSSTLVGVPDLDTRATSYDDPDAQLLIKEVQQEYVRRYGGEDESPVDPDEFAPPNGQFFVAYLDGRPVATGGWRRHDADHEGLEWATNAAEIKRMYVTPVVQRRGLARRMLAHLEATARAEGVEWLVLETGQKQPEAIALYRSSGYEDIPAFGHYACAPLSVHLGKRLENGQ